MKIAGMTLEDAGYKQPKDEMNKDTPVPASGSSIQYPSIWVNSRELPAIKGKDVRDHCILVALVKVKRRSEEEFENDKGKKETRVDATLEIHKAALRPYKESKEPEEMTDAELNDPTYDAKDEE